MKRTCNVLSLCLMWFISYAYFAISSPMCIQSKCKMCKKYGYNHTILPNFAGHSYHQDALIRFRGYVPFIRYGCSEHLELFLCSVYFPKCDRGTRVGPCQSLCRTVESECRSTLLNLGFPWPAELDCANFEAKTQHTENCIEPPNVLKVDVKTTVEDKTTKLPSTKTVTTTLPSFQENLTPTTKSPLQCVPIKYEQCLSFGYNYTALPNLSGHESQSEAWFQLETLKPLIQYGCSSNLMLLVCAKYFPKCSEETNSLVGPCQSLCTQVQSQCEPVYKEFGFDWPLDLHCHSYDTRNEDKYCISAPDNDVFHDQNTDGFRNPTQSSNAITITTPGNRKNMLTTFKYPDGINQLTSKRNELNNEPSIEHSHKNITRVMTKGNSSPTSTVLPSGNARKNGYSLTNFIGLVMCGLLFCKYCSFC